MTDELKPCPFCGEKENLYIHHMHGTCLKPSHKVECENCGAATNYTDNGHIEEWNTRPEEQRLEAENAALKERVELCIKALKDAEWQGYGDKKDKFYCPSCGYSSYDASKMQHRDVCLIGKVLQKEEVE